MTCTRGHGITPRSRFLVYRDVLLLILLLGALLVLAPALARAQAPGPPAPAWIPPAGPGAVAVERNVVPVPPAEH